MILFLSLYLRKSRKIITKNSFELARKIEKYKVKVLKKYKLLSA
jgi:hypothetical protein